MHERRGTVHRPTFPVHRALRWPLSHAKEAVNPATAQMSRVDRLPSYG